jgi:hypothetical protein
MLKPINCQGRLGTNAKKIPGKEDKMCVWGGVGGGGASPHHGHRAHAYEDMRLRT